MVARTVRWFGLFLALPSAVCSEDAVQANADAGASKVKTTTPCRAGDAYSEEEIESFALRHLREFIDPETKMAKKSTWDKEAPRLLLLMGGSGAGKGTLIKRFRELSPTNFGSTFVVHGLDEYLAYVPEYQQTLASGVLDPNAADDCMPVCIRAAKKALSMIAGQGISLVYEETGKDLKRILKRVLPPFREAGYQTFVAFVDNTVDVALERAATRFQEEGRSAPEDYVRQTFANLFENFNALVDDTPGVEEVSLYCDNSCQKFNKDKVASRDCLVCWERWRGLSEGTFKLNIPAGMEAPASPNFLRLPEMKDATFLKKDAEEIDYIVDRGHPSKKETRQKKLENRRKMEDKARIEGGKMPQREL